MSFLTKKVSTIKFIQANMVFRGSEMPEKVILILCDGLRPDAVENCNVSFVKTLLHEWSYCGKAHTVFPSITLPCHMSLFHSCPPHEHGIYGNTFVPAINGRHGLFEQLMNFNKISSIFYSWGELGNLCEPSSLSYSDFISSSVFGGENAATVLTEKAICFTKEYSPDFVFLYLENTDIVGHRFGWESEEYRNAVNFSFGLIEKVITNVSDGYAIIITADHGGHKFTHGTELPCDMTIPLIVKSCRKVNEEKFQNTNIIDIAPSICDLIGIPISKSFIGKSFFDK